MPLINSDNRGLTPQGLLEQLNALDARLDAYSANTPIFPRGTGGIRTELHPLEKMWWPPASNWVGEPGDNGWDAVHADRRHLSSFKHPCVLSVEQLHDFMQAAMSDQYQPRR